MESLEKQNLIYNQRQQRILKQQIVLYKGEEFFISTLEEYSHCFTNPRIRYWRTAVFQSGDWSGIFEDTYTDVYAATWGHEQALKALLAGDFDDRINFSE